MPNKDGTGFQGQDSETKGMGKGNRPIGSGECTCPKCGHKASHTRGIPCTQKKCPKCQTSMKGVNCL